MPDKPLVLLSRRATFSAGRQLGHSAWPREQNQALWGRDALPHGHDYTLDVAYAGPISPSDGMIVNLTDLKPIIARAVAPLDGCFLDENNPLFAPKAPTAENLTLFLWDALQREGAHLGARLYRLKLRESRRQRIAKWVNDMKTSRTYEFAAAHRLFAPGLSDEENLARYDKCSNPAGHGHNYNLEVTISGAVDAQSGYIIAPGILDRIVDEEIFTRFDHKHLNQDCPEFENLVPTSENLAQVIWDVLGARLAREGFRLSKIGLHETQKNYFEVSE